MIVATVLVAACSWNSPGADPTTSPPAATLRAMGIDSPELASRIERGDYAEVVTVHKHDRRPYGMSSGYARWCAGELDTTGWADDHEEQGRVYRFGDLAVVWYWRCHNLSVWTAPAAFDAASDAASAPPEPVLLPLAGPIGAGPEYLAAGAFAGPLGEAGEGYAGGPSGYGAGGLVVAACSCCGLALVPAVPELECWALIAAGLGVMAWRVRR